MGFMPMFASELEFYVYKQSYAEAQRAGLPRPHADDPLHPRLPRAGDDDGRVVHAPDPARDAGRRHPGRVLQGRGVVRPARAQHALRRRRHLGGPPHDLQERRQGDRLPQRRCRPRFMAKPSEKDIGSSCHIHIEPRRSRARRQRLRRRPRGNRPVPPLPRRRAQAHHGSSRCSSRPASTRTSATRPRAGRPPRSAGAATTAPAASASSATAQSRRIECRIPGADVNPYLGYAALLAAGP